MTIVAAYPYTLTNGTTADANQVMADFNQVRNDVNTNAAENGANSTITSLTGLTTALSVVQGGTGVKAPFQSPTAGARNLTIKQASGTTITVTYDEAVVKTALGSSTYIGASGNFTLNAATTGANGLDTGALANNTFYSLYLIYNPTTNTFAVLGTLYATSSATIYAGANLPAGYTASALLSVFRTAGAATILAYTQYDRDIYFVAAKVFTVTAGVAALTTQSLAFQTGGVIPLIPTIAKTVSGSLFATAVGALGFPEVAANAAALGDQFGGGTAAGVANYQPGLNFSRLVLSTAQTLFWNAGSVVSNWELQIQHFAI